MAKNTRGWDESQSPQWRYLLSKESEQKRQKQKDDGEGEIRRNKPGAKVKKRDRSRRLAIEKKFNKKGKEIIYSASPGRPLSLPSSSNNEE